MINSWRDDSVAEGRVASALWRSTATGAYSSSFETPDNAVYKFPYPFIGLEVFGNLVILSITDARRSGVWGDASVAVG